MRALVAAVIVLAAVARVALLSQPGLNTDELYVARYALAVDAPSLADDVHPPLFPALERLVASFDLGMTIEGRVRIVPVLAGTILVALFALVGFVIAGEAGALLGVLVSFLDPSLISMSRLARSYSLSAMLGAAAFLALWEVIRRPECRKRMAALALANALGLYTFYYAGYLCIAQLAIAAMAWRRSRMTARSIAIANVAALALFAPWLVAAVGQFARLGPDSGWVRWDATPYQIARRSIQIFVQHSPVSGLMKSAYLASARLGAASAVVGAGAIVWGAWRAARRRGADLGGFALMDSGGRMGAGFPLAVVAVTIATALAAHFVFCVFIATHYFALLAAPILALFLMAISSLGEGAMRNALVMIVLAAQLLMGAITRGEGREDLREVVRRFDRTARSDAKALVVAHFVKDAFLVYSKRSDAAIALPTDLPGFDPLPRESAAIMPASARDALLASLGGAHEVWIVESHGTRDGGDRGAALARAWLGEAGYRRTDMGRAHGVRWERYWLAKFPRKAAAAN
ncbi:MAG: glycosyltransferase family 39 protein [Deltaproteobacteria bacterium]|nr:glycosyltransferase family 39 protein [Deltaproteobacteria bacterium]